MSAMDKENITPEEKLLKIIENPQTPKSNIKLGPKENALAISSPIAWFKGIHISRDAIFEYANISSANKALAVVCVLLTCFWIFEFARIGVNMNKRLAKITAASTASKNYAAAVTFLTAQAKDVLTQARRRNIFTLLPPKQEIVQTQALEQAVSNYKLVGIIWSLTPQAMIEDSKAGKTNLLSENEIMGDFKIKKILRDKVIISKDDLEWELR
jgi:type II secretory pathway component PulC